MNTSTINHQRGIGVAVPLLPIPERDTMCTSNQINLSSYYTEALDDNIHHKSANTLSQLPKGLQTIDGVDYDLRGVVQLAGFRSEEITFLEYPKKVVGIPVNLRGRFLHFLHASAWYIDASKSMIGTYRIHFEDDRVEVIPLMYKVNIWDCWSKADNTTPLPAWKGTNVRTSSIGEYIRLFHLHWKNPHLGKKIVSIDIISTCLGPGPMLAGITLTE